MVTVKVFTSENLPQSGEQQAMVQFLHTHLEQYGDPAHEIEAAINYALGLGNSPGGAVFRAEYEGQLAGVVVVNRTGMKGYIPEHILVYIATHNQYRGKGIGKALMQSVVDHCPGDIALHVEHNNPAKKLYEAFGFTNPYLEMRLKRNK